MTDKAGLPSTRRVLALVLGLALLHVVLVFGYAGAPWGEYGATLHAVERFARGGAPYRDFDWPHLPLSLWILGGLARLTGPGLLATQCATVALYLALVATYVAYVRMLKPEVLLAAVLAGLVLALAYAARDGVPLPLGGTDPAMAVGTLALLGAAVATIGVLDRPAPGRAVAAGLLAGVCMLAAPTFWAGALYLLAAVLVALRRSALPARARLVGATCVAFGGVVLVGAVAVLAEAGWSGLAAAATLSGHLGEELVRALPDLERVDVEVFVSAAVMLMGVASLWLCLAIREGKAAQWGGLLLLVALTAGAIHLGMSIAIAQELRAYRPPELLTPIQDQLALNLSSGASLTASTLAVLNHRAERHILPALLPALMFLLALTRGRRWEEPQLRRRVLFLLGLCIAGRLWTGWSGVTWSQILVEMPVYALCVQFGAGAWGPRAGRAVLTALSLALIVGVFEYYNQAPGPLTRRGREPEASTARGRVRWSAFAVRQFSAVQAALDGRDPARRRALLAVGPGGGWNYFLGRVEPDEARWSLRDRPARRPGVETPAGPQGLPVFLLDFPSGSVGTPSAGLWLLRWEPPMRPAPERLAEHQRFDRLAAGCAPLSPGDTTALAVRLYDCAASVGGAHATR